MNSIETIICLLLLFMAVPDLCNKFGKPALANAVFVVFGLGLGFVAEKDVVTMIQQAGQVGFLLVLFEVGLEISLPPFREFLRPLKFAVGWSFIQYPILVGLGDLAGLSFPESLIAAAGITGCSLSMAYFGWRSYPSLEEGTRQSVLQIMVALEVVAMVMLSVMGVTAKHGFGWMILANIAGMGMTIFLISRFASHLVRLFQFIIETTTHWRVHFIVLLVLGVCAVGSKFGLSAPKTAFFMGLFMSRAEFRQQSIEDIIAPISRRFLIPIFFVSLGLLINGSLLFTQMALLAFLGAFLVIGFRDVLHQRFFPTGGDRNTFLLLCPNLTMVAVAASSLLAMGSRDAATWTVLIGMFLSIAALTIQPQRRLEGAVATPTSVTINATLDENTESTTEKIGMS